MPDAQDVAREIEDLGYGSLFLPEVAGKECLTQSAAFLSATERLVVGTGIANIHVRIPSAAETGGRTLNALLPGPVRPRPRRQPRPARRARHGRHLRQAAGHHAHLSRADGRRVRRHRARRRAARSGCWPRSAPR